MIDLKTQPSYFKKVRKELQNKLGDAEAHKLLSEAFGISSLAPLGCVPSSRAHKPGNTGTCVEEVTELAKLHNRGLAESLRKLKRRHQGFKYSNPNFFTFLNERIHNPTKHGILSHNTCFFQF